MGWGVGQAYGGFDGEGIGIGRGIEGGVCYGTGGVGGGRVVIWGLGVCGLFIWVGWNLEIVTENYIGNWSIY